MTTTVFLLLLLKHTFCDLFLQSLRTPADKSSITSWALHRHCLDHGVFAFVILLFFVDFKLALLLGLFDYATHTIIDYTKHKIMKYYNVAKNGKVFWALQTIDQASHYTVYFIMVTLIGMNI